ncbi:MAG: rubredoxin [Bacteroidota bacterium]|nr:rubredoxin [Bacteroidota bacterium]
MRYAYQYKINFIGGIVSPGYLHNLLEGLQEAGLNQVRFGLRQQLLIDSTIKDHKKVKAALNNCNADYEINKDVYPNISSSYPAAEIFIKDTWLGEGVYKDIFDLFDYKPHIKINIADSNQTFMPFFTGNINWIASKNSHFWHLYIRFPKTNVLFEWKELIYTNDIARLSKEIEKEIFNQRSLYFDNNNADGNNLYNTIMSTTSFISKPSEEKLDLPSFELPYYEGYNNYGNKSWLGIYRRDELFDINFLKDVCRICLETKSGELYTTPWKSLIVKGIDEKDHHLWSFILGKHRINVRHAANELNWQVEDTNEDGLMIKRLVIREFDKKDVRAYGLCFAVKTQPKSGLFGSVLIRRQFNLIRGQLKALAKYDILYSAGFNPNSKEYILFRSNIAKENLPTYLIALCKYYYEQRSAGELLPGSTYTVEPAEEQKESIEKMIFQCKHCFTVYDEDAGEIDNAIEAGTLFDDLPATYCCPLCEAPASDFKKIERRLLGLQNA